MFKLTVVAGPNRGTSWLLQEGETSLGRQSGNVILLESSRVSKRHCTFIVDSGGVSLRDDGSANGTFVNGALVRQRKLEPGDKVSVGEYVFELVRALPRKAKPALALPSGLRSSSRVSQFPVPMHSYGSAAPVLSSPSAPSPSYYSPAQAGQAPVQQPSDLKEKALFWFENQLMPFFYDLSFKQEWRSVIAGLFGVFILAGVFLAVNPVLELLRESTVREMGRRAQFMARQIVDRNAPYLVARTETKAELGSMDREDGVRVAVLTDLESRILAPAAKYNQYLAIGNEAKLAAAARDAFRKGRESGILRELDPQTIAAVEPVKVYNAQLGRNVVVGMAIVSLDTGLATLDLGETGVLYAKALILISLLGGVFLLIAYRLTLKPFEVLNEDMDRVLKGDMTQVTHEFKLSELNPLWEVINAGLQRVSFGDGQGGAVQQGSNPEDFVAVMRLLGGASGKVGTVLCDSDRRVLEMNSVFEDVTGIRADNSLGQDLSSVARDQAFSVLITDLFSRAQPGADAGPEDFEFSGVSYRVSVSAIGNLGAQPRGYAMIIERKEE